MRRFGGIAATDNFSLDVASGELHAIIGPNGAGKTTLISQLTGQLLPNAGSIRFAGRDITRLPPHDAAGSGWRARSRSRRCCRILPRRTMSRWPRRPMTGTRSISGAMRARKNICARRRERRWRASGSTAAPMSVVSELSHGEQRQLELAVALATKPQLLLLDEPMAGLGVTESARW